eukprot:gene4929-3540_t
MEFNYYALKKKKEEEKFFGEQPDFVLIFYFIPIPFFLHCCRFSFSLSS